MPKGFYIGPFQRIVGVSWASKFAVGAKVTLQSHTGSIDSWAAFCSFSGGDAIPSNIDFLPIDGDSHSSIPVAADYTFLRTFDKIANVFAGFQNGLSATVRIELNVYMTLASIETNHPDFGGVIDNLDAVRGTAQVGTFKLDFVEKTCVFFHL